LHVDPPNVNLYYDHASNQEIPEIVVATYTLDQHCPTKTLNTIWWTELVSSHKKGIGQETKGRCLVTANSTVDITSLKNITHKVMTNIVNDNCCVKVVHFMSILLFLDKSLLVQIYHKSAAADI
jgi:hypothetical protein